MAQELPPELLNAVMQAESRGQRYDAKGQLLTSPKGAKGEMQVLDKTNYAPGFGVAPAKDKSPEERARVGRDYLAALVNRYPDRDTALMAYNWGPGNVDKWLKAGSPMEKVPEETRNYVSKIDKMLTKDTQQAKPAAPAPDRATVEMNKAIDSGISAQAPAAPAVVSRTAAYGPSYQAALAVSMLGDSDEKEDKDPEEPTEAEKFLAEPAAATSLAKMDLSYSSPFAEPAPVTPVKMAAGGVPYAPTALYRPSAKTELNTIKSDWDKYVADAEGFNAEAQKYQTEQYDPYVAKLDEYNKAIEAWNAGSRESDFTGVEPTAPGEFARVAPVEPTKDQAYATALQEKMQKDVANRQTALNVAANPAAYGLSMPAFFSKGGEVEPTPEEIAAAIRPATVNPNIQRQGAAARQLASMRDVNTLPDPKTYAAVSGFLGTAPDEQGFSAMHPQAAGIKSAGEAGFYTGTALGVAPVAAALRAPAAALARSEQAKGALERLFPAAQPMYAVKPKGGTFIYSPEDAALAKPISSLATKLQEYKVQGLFMDASDEVQAFLNAKAPKYFTTTYGTASDPLRTAIAKKQIAPFGSDAPAFNPYLTAEDTLENRLGLEKAYDIRTGISARALQPEGVPSGFERRMRQEMSEKMGQEGVTAEFRNLPFSYSLPKSEFDKYRSLAEPFERMLNRQDRLPENLQQALRTGEPLYDVANPQLELLRPKNVIEALEQIPANKLKNMSFADALIKGTQELAPVRNYLTAVDLAEKGAVVPRKALDMFTSPVVKAPSVDGQWVQLDKSLATLLEGKLLKHSIGNYNAGDKYGTGYTELPYGGKKAFDEGLVRVYSLRDDQGMPKISLEMAKSDHGKGNTWNVSQIRGRFNSEPPKETWDDIFNLLDKVDSKDGLNRIKDTLYSKSPTGESIPGNYVSWADRYDLYKKQNAK